MKRPAPGEAHCPKCSGHVIKVIDSRFATKKWEIRRRRLCLDCAYRWTTYEALEKLPPPTSAEITRLHKVIRNLCEIIAPEDFNRIAGIESRKIKCLTNFSALVNH